MKTLKPLRGAQPKLQRLPQQKSLKLTLLSRSERSPLESFYMSVGLAVLRSLFGSGFKIGSSSKNGKHNGFGRTKS